MLIVAVPIGTTLWKTHFSDFVVSLQDFAYTDTLPHRHMLFTEHRF